MKLLDKIALNRLIKILTNFVITIIKLFHSSQSINIPDSPITPKKKKQPLRDFLKNTIDKITK